MTETYRKAYCPLFRFCRFCICLVNRRMKVIGDVPAAPVVFVGHHQNMKGVVRTMEWLPVPVRLWVLACFCDKDECYRQYYGYTFTERLGWPCWLARPVAWIVSRFVARLTRSARTIPVFRGSVKGLKATMDQSVEAFCAGENILLFPDVDYSGDTDDMGEIYKGFLALDRFCHQKTGKHVDFVPVYTRRETMELVIGQPSRLTDGESFVAGRDRVAKELVEKMNRST